MTVGMLVLGSSAAGVEGSEFFSLVKREPGIAGDLFDGTVLLRCTPEPEGATKEGVVGLGIAPE